MEILALFAIVFVVFVVLILGLAMLNGGYDGGSFALLGIMFLSCLIYVVSLMSLS